MDGIVNAIINLMDSISSWFSQFFFQITRFFNSVISVLNYIRSMLESMRYGLTTILSGVMDMVEQLFNSGL